MQLSEVMCFDIKCSWAPKYIIFLIRPPFCQFYKKVVLRSSEHRDVIETQKITVCPLQSFLANLVPGYAAFGIFKSLWQ